MKLELYPDRQTDRHRELYRLIIICPEVSRIPRGLQKIALGAGNLSGGSGLVFRVRRESALERDEIIALDAYRQSLKQERSLASIASDKRNATAQFTQKYITIIIMFIKYRNK